jgi:pimeloyl-[acyl-carrier protein] synthase
MDIDFDSQIFLQNPHFFYDQMRVEHPCFYSERYHSWLLTDYTSAKTVLSDEKNFIYNPFDKGARTNTNTSSARLYKNWFIYQSEEKQKKFRKVVSPYFSAKSIAHLESYVETEVQNLCYEIKENEVDVIDTYASILPIKIIIEILGISDSHVLTIKKNAKMIAKLMHFTTSKKDMQFFDFAIFTLEKIIISTIEKKDFNDAGLIAYLSKQVDSGIITKDEFIYNSIFFVMSAVESTVYSTGNALMLLLNNPSQKQLFITNKTTIDQSIDELLRFESSISYARRFAAKNIEMNGKTIKKGDCIILLLNAVNRDPLIFSNPNVLDLTRPLTKNLAFGHGAHFCLGAHLAKMEIKIALNYFFEKYPNCKPIDQEIIWNKRFGFRGLEKLMVTLT